MCGLCLPHCPTYIKSRDENESPRGRISLIKALAEDKLDATPKLIQHLERCLMCRACESICPSEVRFGYLMDTARNNMGHQSSTFAQRTLNSIIDSKSRMKNVGRFLYLYQKSGLQKIARKTGLLTLTKAAGLDNLLPEKTKQPASFKSFYPATGEEKGQVALFTGCIAQILDQETLDAAIQVLTLFGFGVHVPEEQTCCGALHLHNGQFNKANEQAKTNMTAFNKNRIDAIISVASGCGATLSEYSLSSIASKNKDFNTQFTSQVQDISQFLNHQEWPEQLRFKPLNARVAIHDPCTLTHVLKQAEPPYQLLSRIPEIELVPLGENKTCCGAAGSYMIDHPDMARALRDDKLAQIKILQPNILLTSNIGCAMHLRAGLREAGLDVEVMHPIVLLRKQLDL